MSEDEDDRTTERAHATPAAEPTPRWVKVFALVALAVVAAVVIVFVTGRGGEHGPGRHGASVDVQPALAAER